MWQKKKRVTFNRLFWKEHILSGEKNIKYVSIFDTAYVPAGKMCSQTDFPKKKSRKRLVIALHIQILTKRNPSADISLKITFSSKNGD